MPPARLNKISEYDDNRINNNIFYIRKRFWESEKKYQKRIKEQFEYSRSEQDNYSSEASLEKRTK